MNKALTILVASSFLLLTAGCGMDNDGHNGHNGVQPARVNNVDRDNNNFVELNGRDNNQKMDVADEIADRVAVMQEIDHANVIVSGNTAYVSVRLNNQVDDKGSQNQNSGTKRGSENPTGIINQNGDGNSTRTPSITQDNEVPNTNRNRHAVNINNGSTISSDLERKISKKVKAYDNRIENVYITTDTGFNNDMTNYSNRIRNGNTDQTLLDDFNNNVRRVFPNLNNSR